MKYKTIEDFLAIPVHFYCDLQYALENIESPIQLSKLPSSISMRLDNLLLLVRFTDAADISGYQQSYTDLQKTDRFLFMGEIFQCPGHVVIQNMNTGKTLTMIHDDDLEIIPLEEV